MQEGLLNLCQKKSIFGMVKFFADCLKIVIFRPFLDEIHYFFFEKYSELNKEQQYVAFEET